MAKSVAQLDELGCGLACVAVVSSRTYKFIKSMTTEDQARLRGFCCRELVGLLRVLGYKFSFKYVNQKTQALIYRENSIVYIRKSKQFPKGHYLVSKGGVWMDPWINFDSNKDIQFAVSGYRNRLPGQPIYVVYKELE